MKNKKGFTLVELIVVIGIVGILTMAVVPIMTTFSNLHTVRAYAKSFYYAVQNTMVDYMRENKLPIPDARYLSGSKDTIFIEAEFKDDSPDISSLRIFLGAKDAMKPTPHNVVECDKNLSEEDELLTSLKVKLNRQLEKAEHFGYFYAVIDKELRVTAAYWSETSIPFFQYHLDPANYIFEREGVINGNKVGGYPLGVDFSGETVMYPRLD